MQIQNSVHVPHHGQKNNNEKHKNPQEGSKWQLTSGRYKRFLHA